MLHNKLKALKRKIKDWAKNNFCRVETKIVAFEGVLESIELVEEVRALCEFELVKKHQVQIGLRDAIQQEETLWSRKARI